MRDLLEETAFAASQGGENHGRDFDVALAQALLGLLSPEAEAEVRLGSVPTLRVLWLRGRSIEVWLGGNLLGYTRNRRVLATVWRAALAVGWNVDASPGTRKRLGLHELRWPPGYGEPQMYSLALSAVRLQQAHGAQMRRAATGLGFAVAGVGVAAAAAGRATRALAKLLRTRQDRRMEE